VLLKKLRQLLSKRKIRFFAPNWSLDRSGRRLTAKFKRRKRSSITHGKNKLKFFRKIFRLQFLQF